MHIYMNEETRMYRSKRLSKWQSGTETREMLQILSNICSR